MLNPSQKSFHFPRPWLRIRKFEGPSPSESSRRLGKPDSSIIESIHDLDRVAHDSSDSQYPFGLIGMKSPLPSTTTQCALRNTDELCKLTRRDIERGTKRLEPLRGKTLSNTSDDFPRILQN